MKSGSLSASDIKNGSLLATDFKAGQLPAGPAGPAGSARPAGPAGPAGATSVVTRRADRVMAANNGEAVIEAGCQTGERAVGGGAGTTGPLDGQSAVYVDEPREADGSAPEEGDPATMWQAGALNSAPNPRTLNVFVLCASP